MASLFLTFEQAAQITGYSLRHFRRVYFEEGDGRITQIGRRMFIVRSDFEAWAKRNEKILSQHNARIK